jgi:hypothetical protein
MFINRLVIKQLINIAFFSRICLDLYDITFICPFKEKRQEIIKQINKHLHFKITKRGLTLHIFLN